MNERLKCGWLTASLCSLIKTVLKLFNYLYGWRLGIDRGHEGGTSNFKIIGGGEGG